MVSIKVNKENGNENDYYYDILKVINKRNNIRNNEKVNINDTYKLLVLKMIISLIIFIAFTIYIFCFKTNFVVYLFYLVSVLLVIYLLLWVKKISSYKKSAIAIKGKRVVTIDKNIITSGVSSNSKLEVEIKSIDFIYITKYSIVFIPKEDFTPVIALPIMYKDELFDALKKEKIDIKVVNN